MSDQPTRQPFRFRIPWVMNPIPPRPLPPPPPPTQPQPAQITTTERPPFRPGGVAPPRPSAQPSSPTRTAPQPPSPKVSSEPQAPPKTEFRPPSPPQATPKSQSVTQPRTPSRTVPSQPPQVSPSPKTEPQLPATQPKPATRKTSQSPSPSRTSQPQPATQRTSQPSSPSLTATKPERTSQPSSPVLAASQVATKTVSHPYSPPRMGSQEETKIRKASPPRSPSVQSPQSQPTIQAPSKPISPSATRTEPPSDKMPLSWPEMYKPVPEYPPKNGSSTEPGSQHQKQSLPITYQPDLQTKQPSYTPVRPDQSPLSEKKLEEVRRDETKIKPKEKPMIQTDEEPKQMASGSNLVPRGKLGSKSDEEKQLLKKQTPTDEKEILAMDSNENVRRTAIPISQGERKERHEYFPKPSVPHGERAAPHKDIRDDISKLVHKLSTEHPNLSKDEHPVSVITLAGENRGATMHLDSNAERKDGAIRIRRGYKLDQDAEATTDVETSSKAEKSNDPATTEEPTSMVYINSNTQSVNNSLVFNSSVNEGSPGVHLVFSQNPREPPKSSGKTESVQVRKADFSTIQSQKLAYEPTIRRRCLRGLMLEPSDSDPNNPDKPRRHGCRYTCEDNKKAEDNGNEG